MSRETYFDNGSVLREMIGHSDGESFTARTLQDVEPVIDLASQMRDENAVIGHRKSSNLVPVAEIPMMVYEQAFKEGWLNDKKAWKKWLNDPQNKVFRITDGRM